MRFAIGLQRMSSDVKVSTLMHGQLTFPLRADTVPWLPPCSHDPHRHSHYPPLYAVSAPIQCSRLMYRIALLLAGCSSSSPLIPDIFLISLYYKSYPPNFAASQVDPGVTTAIANIVGQAQLEVRVGYFGICINPDGGSFLCSNNATSLATQVSVDQDPLNLIWVASTFKDSIVFPYLM